MNAPALAIVCVLTLLGGGGPPAGRQAATPHGTLGWARPCQSAGTSNVQLSGVAYGPYHAGQDPNARVYPSPVEIAGDFATLACLSRNIRIYSSLGPAAAIVHDAERAGMSVNLGIWLGPDPSANDSEISAGIQLAASRAVTTLTVGNEVLLRGDLSVSALESDIQRVRAGVATLGHPVRVTTADTSGSWLAHPDLAASVDYVTAHFYPFWWKIPISQAMQSLQSAYADVQQAIPGKQIVIGETGWPSDGPPQGPAVPGAANQSLYFRSFVAWANAANVAYYYFDAFDEGWKTNEMGVGTHWGLYGEDGSVKASLADLLPPPAPSTTLERSIRDVYVGGLEAGFGLGLQTSTGLAGWVTASAADASLQLAYPAGQAWGTAFVTAGPPAPLGSRGSVDLSGYRTLLVDMRAAVAGQCVRLGIKGVAQLDDGSEATVPECLTTTWSTIMLGLWSPVSGAAGGVFGNVDLQHLYVVLEVDFRGASSEMVELRNLRYTPQALPRVSVPPPPLAPVPFTVYADAGSPDNHYVPSGFMGDYGDVTLHEDSQVSPHGGATCIQVVYSAARSQQQSWAGVYWQDPPNNWGSTAGTTGFNLTGASALSFWVRGTTGQEKVEFLVGGDGVGNTLVPRGTDPDSFGPVVIGPITLSTGWQHVTIPLTGQSLTHVIGGFAWVASAADDPGGATFYLDDIQFV